LVAGVRRRQCTGCRDLLTTSMRWSCPSTYARGPRGAQERADRALELAERALDRLPIRARCRVEQPPPSSRHVAKAHDRQLDRRQALEVAACLDLLGE